MNAPIRPSRSQRLWANRMMTRRPFGFLRIYWSRRLFTRPATEPRRIRPEGVGAGKHAMNGNKFRHTHVSWPKRIIKEMKGNPRVMDAVFTGKLDRWVGARTT